MDDTGEKRRRSEYQIVRYSALCGKLVIDPHEDDRFTDLKKNPLSNDFCYTVVDCVSAIRATQRTDKIVHDILNMRTR